SNIQRQHGSAVSLETRMQRRRAKRVVTARNALTILDKRPYDSAAAGNIFSISLNFSSVSPPPTFVRKKMRLSVVRKVVIACSACLLSLPLAGGSAYGQGKPKPKPPAGQKKPPTKPPPGGGSQAIELDEPATPPAGEKGTPTASGPPPVAGQ